MRPNQLEGPTEEEREQPSSAAEIWEYWICTQLDLLYPKEDEEKREGDKEIDVPTDTGSTQ